MASWLRREESGWEVPFPIRPASGFSGLWVLPPAAGTPQPLLPSPGHGFGDWLWPRAGGELSQHRTGAAPERNQSGMRGGRRGPCAGLCSRTGRAVSIGRVPPVPCTHPSRRRALTPPSTPRPGLSQGLTSLGSTARPAPPCSSHRPRPWGTRSGASPRSGNGEHTRLQPAPRSRTGLQELPFSSAQNKQQPRKRPRPYEIRPLGERRVLGAPGWSARPGPGPGGSPRPLSWPPAGRWEGGSAQPGGRAPGGLAPGQHSCPAPPRPPCPLATAPTQTTNSRAASAEGRACALQTSPLPCLAAEMSEGNESRLGGDSHLRRGRRR